MGAKVGQDRSGMQPTTIERTREDGEAVSSAPREPPNSYRRLAHAMC